MQLSSRIRTAISALVELASREDCCGRTVTLAELASGRGLSPAYLEQLFGRLRRTGLVVSARGPGGGYRLAKPPGLVAIAEIVAALEEAEPAEPGCPCCDALWQGLDRHMALYLRRVTLEDVVRQRLDHLTS